MYSVNHTILYFLLSFGIKNLLALFQNQNYIHALKILTFQFTPVTHMVYLEIQLLEVNFSMAKSK